MLALGIRYLTGFVVAAQPDNRDYVEWPPHPGRVFMALAAAHFLTGSDDQERKALEWLEGLPPPLITAPEALQRSVATHYVPVNDKAGPSKAILQSLPLTRDRQPRTFARAWLTDDRVFLSWPEIVPSDSIREAMESLCAKVTRIGHSSSLVQVWLAKPAEVGNPNWIPDENAIEQLRIAAPGSVNDLTLRYNGEAVDAFGNLKAALIDLSDRKALPALRNRLKQEFGNEPPPQLRPELPFSHGYARQITPDHKIAVTGTAFSPDLIVFRLEAEDAPFRYMDLPSVLVLTQHFREAILSSSNDLPDRARSILSGLDSNNAPLHTPHLAFLPMAFVGQFEHADGHLLGVSLVLPNDLSTQVRRSILLGISRVKFLDLGRMGVWRLEPETSIRPTLNLRPDVWTAYPFGSTFWSSVTPIVFDRHPKAKDKSDYYNEVSEMISESCVRIGLPRPCEVIVTSVSAHIGVPPSFAFPRLIRKDNSKRRHTHAIIGFEQPVVGPITIGAGRYRGYGFFRPLKEAA